MDRDVAQLILAKLTTINTALSTIAENITPVVEGNDAKSAPADDDLRSEEPEPEQEPEQDPESEPEPETRKATTKGGK